MLEARQSSISCEQLSRKAALCQRVAVCQPAALAPEKGRGPRASVGRTAGGRPPPQAPTAAGACAEGRGPADASYRVAMTWQTLGGSGAERSGAKPCRGHPTPISNRTAGGRPPPQAPTAAKKRGWPRVFTTSGHPHALIEI